MGLDLKLYVTVDAGEPSLTKVDLFDCNITHNLNRMATELGIYSFLWNKEDTTYVADDLIAPLWAALIDMRNHQDYYIQFDAPNGWGTYDNFLPWLEKLLDKCEQYPKANVSHCR
jgi:hypothetical protein|tara:strand:+ start:1209 stop:1553 length:345 start_codon:yes stop_codon:yes gene_type:complete